MKKLIILPLYIILIFLMHCQPKIKVWELTSPEEKVVFQLKQEKLNGGETKISYEVFLNSDEGEKTAVYPSELGILLKSDSLTSNLHYQSEETRIEINETYEMIAGKKRTIRNHGFEKTVVFENDKGKLLAIDFRAYDDGAALRYRILDNGEDSLYTVTGELTSFNLGNTGKAWMQPYDTVTMYTPAYETFYRNGIPIGTHAPGHEGWAFPALFETNGMWLLLTESNLKDNFYGAHLQPDADQGIYRIRLPEKEEAMNTGPSEPTQPPPWEMPWRVIMVGESLGSIVESNLVNNLADPSVVNDNSWIKPGRASWSWWSDHDSPQDYKKLIPFIDMAAELGWEYSLVDANWNGMKNGDLKKVVDYAREKGVGILVWYNSGGPHNRVTEQPRDAMYLEKRRKEEFKKLKEWGVKGVKVDFFQSDKPNIIRLYHDILRDAEEFEILCNFHGCTIPRGWRRTHPHMLTLEAVRGAECYSFDPRYPEAAPWHNTILPFTRNVIGPMDYTPVTFSDQTYPHITGYGHELALSIVFESGIIHFADRVNAYLQSPDFVQSFLKEVPASWDQTRWIAGYPGKFCVIARQKGQKWYIGAINGQEEEQKVALTLPFLKEGDYMMAIIGDGDKERSFKYSKKPFRPGDRMEIAMHPFGGFVAEVNLLE
jgi:alpha-glucosidase